jgi:hypothetical integral membrane protein (TIGR02206 family)
VPARWDERRPFVLFGPDHLAALAVTALVAVGLVRLVRRAPAARAATAVRLGLAALLLGGTAATLGGWAGQGTLEWLDLLPLHLCDMLIFVAVYALVTRHALACELLYFWAGAGAVLAMVGPDVANRFPDPGFLSFFALHGLVVASAAVLVFGLGCRPRPGAPRRVFLLTNAYAAAVGLVDVALDANFLFLRGKPAAATLLDWLGPWPVYLVVAEALAAVLFMALDLPFRAGRRLARPARAG